MKAASGLARAGGSAGARGRRLGWGGGLLLSAGLALPACGPETVEIVAIRGCGLDQEFSGLRVRVLGDLPASSGSELLLGPEERGTLAALDPDATGVGAEGLFGTTVTALGRSYGIDPAVGRGRIPGIEPDRALLPIYFAAPDSLCELDELPSPRTELRVAGGPEGDLLAVGGRGSGDELLDEIVHVDLLSGEAQIVDRLAGGRVGHSVHARGGREFVILGGARAGSVVDELQVIDLSSEEPGLGEPTPLMIGDTGDTGDAPLALAHHAFAPSPVDGRVLIAGGCEAVDEAGRCQPGSASSRAFWFDPDGLVMSELPDPLVRGRHQAHAALTRDGLAYLAGGRDEEGTPLRSLERWSPELGWELVFDLGPEVSAIAGLAVLDGELVLMSDPEGAIHWWSASGSGVLEPTSRAPPLAPLPAGLPIDRPLAALPGERVLVDGWLFAPGTAAIDPASERIELGIAQRSGGGLLELLDGTLVIAGGRLVADGQLAEPALLRLRPALDGPDEWIPDLAGPQTDAFVVSHPGRATVVVGGLRLDGVEGEEPGPMPSVHAHVRGFRSGHARLEFSSQADPGAAAHVVVGQGARALVSIRLTGPQVEVTGRSAAGSLEALECGLGSAAGDEPLVLEIDSGGRRLRLRGPDGELADCSLPAQLGPGPQGVFVGFGVSGSGSARFFGLRLARG